MGDYQKKHPTCSKKKKGGTEGERSSDVKKGNKVLEGEEGQTLNTGGDILF